VNATTIPAPPESRHGPDRTLDPTLTSVKVADLWQRIREEPMPTDWTHGHRLYDGADTTIRDLQPIQLRPGRRWGLRARLERFLAHFRRVQVDEPTEIIPAVLPAEKTLPVPRHGDVVELLRAAGARGIRWEVDEHFTPGPCEWCQRENAEACMQILGDYEVYACRDCGPHAVKWETTTDDLVIELPGHAAYVAEVGLR
jgi:hypothetical protein